MCAQLQVIKRHSTTQRRANRKYLPIARRSGTPEMATTITLANRQCQKPRVCRCRRACVWRRSSAVIAIPRSRLNTAMSQQFLNVANVHSILKQMRRKRMAQCMKRCWFGDPRLDQSANQPLQCHHTTQQVECQYPVKVRRTWQVRRTLANPQLSPNRPHPVPFLPPNCHITLL